MTMKLNYEIRGNILYISDYPLNLFFELKKCFTFDRLGFDRLTNERTKTPETVASGFDVNGKPVGISALDKGIPKSIVTLRGYEKRMLAFCTKHNVQPVKTSTPKTGMLDDPSVFVPSWDGVPADYEFRYMQKEILQAIADNAGGIVACAAGYGKTNVLGLLPCVFPKARILISSYKQQVYQTIGERVRQFILPGTKYFIQGKGTMTPAAVKQARVVVCGNRTIPKILAYGGDDFDIYASDEVHLAAAPETFNSLSQMVRPRMFGFTASPSRSDGAQFRLLGLFGERLVTVDNVKATEKGMIVPIKVIWCDVNLQRDPTKNCHHAYKKHMGIWFNTLRNKLIAGAAKSYDDDVQVLIIVETVKHALALKALLPNYIVVSADTKNLDKTRNAFAKGTLKRVIATGVWREGVSFNDLQVLINATGVKSDIANIQLTGRVSRLSEGKEMGIVYDFFDNWNPEFEAFSKSRKRLYEAQGFKQENINPRELLQHLDE